MRRSIDTLDKGKLNERPTSPATIVSMSLQPVIPSWVALQQRPRPLRRLRIASLSTLLLSSFQQPTATVTQIACLRPGVHFTSACFRSYFIEKQSPRRGSVEILEGFPRPVGAVVNLHLVFHRFHQRRHSL